jgi:hypothetical protein
VKYPVVCSAVFDPEVAWPEIQGFQGSWVQWRNKTCEHEYGTGTDAAWMEETVARKRRYVRAIRWLIDNLTEDAEIEKVFVS